MFKKEALQKFGHRAESKEMEKIEIFLVLSLFCLICSFESAFR